VVEDLFGGGGAGRRGWRVSGRRDTMVAVTRTGST
jgi:hypothetical protein